MNDPKRCISLGIMLLIFLLFWGLALNRALFLTQEYLGVSVRIQGAGVSRESLERAHEESAESMPRTISAWSRSTDKIMLTNEDIGASAAVRKIAVYGSMADVFPMKVLSGALPVSMDESGCVIDDKTALSLFRNIDVVGARIPYGEKSYLVRAVIASLEPVILIREADARYDNLELTYGDIESGGGYARDFVYRYGWAQEYTIVENGFFATAAAGLSVLPAWLAIATAFAALLREAKKFRCIPLQLVILFVLTAAMLVLPNRLFGFTFYWPDRFLPTRWSDFEFWPRLSEELHSYFNGLLFLVPTSKDIQWFSAVRGLLLYVGIACVAAVWLLVSFCKESNYYVNVCTPERSIDNGKCAIEKHQKDIPLHHGAQKR